MTPKILYKSLPKNITAHLFQWLSSMWQRCFANNNIKYNINMPQQANEYHPKIGGWCIVACCKECPTPIPPKEDWLAVFRHFYDDNEAGGSSRWFVTPDTVKNFIKGLLATKEKHSDTANVRLERNIGMLRQALNEDRITDPKKMVTNEYIKHWLEL